MLQDELGYDLAALLTNPVEGPVERLEQLENTRWLTTITPTRELKPRL